MSEFINKEYESQVEVYTGISAQQQLKQLQQTVTELVGYIQERETYEEIELQKVNNEVSNKIQLLSEAIAKLGLLSGEIATDLNKRILETDLNSKQRSTKLFYISMFLAFVTVGMAIAMWVHK